MSESQQATIRVAHSTETLKTIRTALQERRGSEPSHALGGAIDQSIKNIETAILEDSVEIPTGEYLVCYGAVYLISWDYIESERLSDAEVRDALTEMDDDAPDWLRDLLSEAKQLYRRGYNQDQDQGDDEADD